MEVDIKQGHLSFAPDKRNAFILCLNYFQSSPARMANVLTQSRDKRNKIIIIKRFFIKLWMYYPTIGQQWDMRTANGLKEILLNRSRVNSGWLREFVHKVWLQHGQ